MIGRVTSICLIILGLSGLFQPAPGQAGPSGITYYVSSSQGDDQYDGLSQSTPFSTIYKVNSLALQPGDSVRFKCGDEWHADPLIITRSGSAGQPITFTSYPAGCTNQPVLSGTQTVTGWSPYVSNFYTTDLSAGANAEKFPDGVNQLFRQNLRLRLGRWPNLDAGDGGYSTIAGQPASNRITDSELPSGDWSGAVAHIKGMRWYILNRQVTGSSAHSLSLGSNLDCWGGNCTGWGYFLNNHLNTLDQDGEWYYDSATHQLYLYTTAGSPADNQTEASVILRTDDRSWGGIVLGEDLGDEIAYVTIDNFALSGWFRHGIATPTNLAHYENHDLVTVRGMPLTYTLTVMNEGLIPATQVILTHPIVDVIVDTNWKASTGGIVQQSSTRYIWNLPDISPGMEVTITVTGVYINTLEPGASLVMSAEVTTSTPDRDPVNNVAWLRLGAWQPVICHSSGGSICG